jgi:hypothetical protein
MKFRITPIMGNNGKLLRHMTLMPGVKFEDLTVKDMIEAEKIFKSWCLDNLEKQGMEEREELLEKYKKIKGG